MKMENINFKLEQIKKEEKRDIFEFKMGFVHGDADGYTVESFSTRSKKRAFGFYIILSSVYDCDDRNGYKFEDIVETFKETIELPENINVEEACKNFLKDTFIEFEANKVDENNKKELEETINNLCTEMEILVGDTTTLSNDYAQLEDCEIKYFDELGKEFLIKHMSAKWEDIKPSEC